MDDNLRETFRIDPGSDLTARLTYQGRSVPCELHNLSAGGALVSCPIQLPDGASCELVLSSGTTTGPNDSLATLPSRVLSSHATRDGHTELRLQATSSTGSAQFEATMRLVMAAQRRQLARQAGTAESSPMQSSSERRRGLRARMRERFTKRSMRPDQHD